MLSDFEIIFMSGFVRRFDACQIIAEGRRLFVRDRSQAAVARATYDFAFIAEIRAV